MLILTIRTDKPEAELGIYDDLKRVDYYTWQAHRELAETIHLKIRDILDSQHKKLNDLEGMVVFQGPGSFTGLRIGVAVANSLADGLQIPIIGSQGENWKEQGITRLQNHESDTVVKPEYGALPHITVPKG